MRRRRPHREHPTPAAVPYAELHARSNFSFLDGASSPEELLEQASELGLTAIALTDRDGLYGIVHMAEAAEVYPQIATVFGAELSLGLTAPPLGVAEPEGATLTVLVRREEGYHRLAAALTAAQLAGGEKGRPTYDLADLAARAEGHWVVLTGGRRGQVRQALVTGIPVTGAAQAGTTPGATSADRDGHAGPDRPDRPHFVTPDPAAPDRAARVLSARDLYTRGADAAAHELDTLIDLFGASNVVVELIDHGLPLDTACNDILFHLAEQRGLDVVATGDVYYASPDQHRLSTALSAVRARRSLDEMDGWLPASGSAHLRSGEEMARRFARYPGAVERSVMLAAELAFSLRRARPGLPKQQVPDGHTPMSYLRELVWAGAAMRYPNLPETDRARIERELAVIEEKNFPGYFLIVWDIVKYAKDRGILCQGRGSAANSAVCFLLGITAIDSIFYDLPFERFLSSMRDEEPDIDVDFDSDRREEVIQYVYGRYGRQNAAQVANVISYRPKNAVRDMAKALGHSPGQQDAWSKQVERWGAVVSSSDHDIPQPVVDLAHQVLKFPRHLGIHSGGMVLTDRPVGEVVPIEHARMENRTVLQWDKDDCAWMGLVKFDLLGLGMLAGLQYTFDLVANALGERWTLETIPREEAGVYDQLCRADSVGVFQVESRAQMGLLPRLQPRKFYDLVVQIAMVRPGPIQGGAVHPFVRRKLGEEPITYLHPKLEEPLKRTLGVPVFQEQLMQVAMAVGGCTGEDADLLRRAMGSKRGIERIESLKTKLYAGMAENGITGEVADDIYGKIQAFANFGFAESHSLSFGLLVYASSWMRLHYPAAFLAALLRAQPMGFYSPQSLVADARRHGVEVRRPDILRSDADPVLEPHSASDSRWLSSERRRSPRIETPTGDPECLHFSQPPVPEYDASAHFDCDDHRRDGALAVRLGLADVRGIGQKVAQRIVAERRERGDFRDMADLVHRTGLDTVQLESLAAAGAFEAFGMSQREALWAAGDAAQNRAEYLDHSHVSVQPPLFALPTDAETLVSDLWATGISTDDHPIRHVRTALDARGAYSALALRSAESGRRIEVGGVVTHRQRPATASGITFINLEDETGLCNVICSVGVWNRYRRVVRESPALIVRGILERSMEGVVNVVADRFEPLVIVPKVSSRDFR